MGEDRVVSASTDTVTLPDELVERVAQAIYESATSTSRRARLCPA